jgi:hypothetical protein
MNLQSTLDGIEKNPEEYLDRPCVLSLDAFMQGYRCADEQGAEVLAALAGLVDGPAEANAFARAYLLPGSSEAAMRTVLRHMQNIVRAGGLGAGRAGPFAGQTFMEVLGEPILKGRAAMFLGVSTVGNLFNFVSGFLCGFDVVDRARAKEQRETLAAFERWFQAECGCPGTAWYKLVRIFCGEWVEGLRLFGDRWKEFEGRDRVTV